jgi:hypothetical protein
MLISSSSRHETSGSFIRVSKKINWGISIVDALLQKYASSDDEIKAISKACTQIAPNVTVESVGFEKIASQLRYITTSVNHSGQC